MIHRKADNMEATFRGLSNSKYWNESHAGKGIIVTVRPLACVTVLG
jgi:hypothetical protein